MVSPAFPHNGTIINQPSVIIKIYIKIELSMHLFSEILGSVSFFHGLFLLEWGRGEGGGGGGGRLVCMYVCMFEHRNPLHACALRHAWIAGFDGRCSIFACGLFFSR